MSNQQWERIKPLLPPQKSHTGCPAKDHRTIVNGILWILRTGFPGETYRNVMGHGQRFQDGFTIGAKRVCGRRC